MGTLLSITARGATGLTGRRVTAEVSRRGCLTLDEPSNLNSNRGQRLDDYARPTRWPVRVCYSVCFFRW